jgi:periplasmic protein TonB
VFTRLVASSRNQSQFRRPSVIVGSVAAHALLLAGLIWASASDASTDVPAPAENEEVTYIDIAQIPEPPPEDMVFEEPPADAPPPAPAPRVAVARPPAAPRTAPARPRTAPAAAPNVAAPSSPEPAGFQELRTPPTVIGVAPPNPTAPAVRAEDFGGRGQAGGTAGGTPAPGTGTGRIGTGTDASGAGTGTAGTPGGTGTGPPTGTFSANLVDRPASLRNQADVVRLLQRLYPPRLKETGIEGSVQVQFVVTADGRVDMSTVQILSASHPDFGEATRRVLQDLRFTPARKGEHNVRMLTVLPIQWKMQR